MLLNFLEEIRFPQNYDVMMSEPSQNVETMNI